MNQPLSGIVCTEFFSIPIGALGLAARRLIRALPQWHLPSGGRHAVISAARFRPAKVRAFVGLSTDREQRQDINS
jgi:hypothetical protein